MAKAADATTVTVGQTVTYRITVHNTGPNDATGVTATDQLPDGLTFISAEGPGSYAPATGQWTVGDLADGVTATLVLRAKATKAGLIGNTATATANEKDPDTTNNTDTVSVCVEPAPSCCDPCASQNSPQPIATRTARRPLLRPSPAEAHGRDAWYPQDACPAGLVGVRPRGSVGWSRGTRWLARAP